MLKNICYHICVVIEKGLVPNKHFCLERWKNVLMDLSKGFDTLNYDLFIAKLHAYGFSEESLQLIKSYLTNRWQRTKANASFSNWTKFLLGLPQKVCFWAITL